MAGTLNVDTLKADSNLKLQIASANVAFIDSSGLNVVNGNLTIGGATGNLIIGGSTVNASSLSQLNANGSISAGAILSVNANTIISGTIPLAQIPRLSAVKFPVGTVLQTQYVSYTTAYSSTSYNNSGSNTLNRADFDIVSGFSVSITPTSATSKIAVFAHIASWHGNTTGQSLGAYIARGTSSTPDAYSGLVNDFWTGTGSGIGSNINIAWVDSPGTTSSITYQARVLNQGSSGTWGLNKDYNSNNYGNSHIIVMEIAQ